MTPEHLARIRADLRQGRIRFPSADVRALVLEIERLNEIYVSAVKGRQDFRQAYRRARTEKNSG